MTKEFGWPQPLGTEAVSVAYLSEEHGVLTVKDPKAVAWQPGDRVVFRPSHCCTTVNLHDWLYVVKDGTLVAVWPISARGCVQ
jgi:3-hydroxy-D-aspartate aldolase